MSDQESVAHLEDEMNGLFSRLSQVQKEIHAKLSVFSDGKTLKGNELVGWLGEIYGKLLLDGKLVGDREEHDFVCSDGRRVSVKARKGWNSGWRQTSAIPKIDGPECPTHLLFVHLNDDYSIDRIWLLEWESLASCGRFRKHIVRGEQRSFIFHIDEQKDADNVVYAQAANHSLQADFPDGPRPELNR